MAIGVLLGVIAIVLIIEMKSLLIGEGATVEEEAALREALETGGVDRVIHMKTQYLGPDELLVAAKITVGSQESGAQIAAEINDAERRIRAAVPIATAIYLEPDLYIPDAAATPSANGSSARTLASGEGSGQV